jgi:hypothetical protein
MTKRTFFRWILVLSTTALFLNCDVSDTSGGGGLNLNTADLFPFQNNANWWKYSEPGGHTISISVLDTITDNQTTYFKVSFAEKGRDTTDNWFRRSSSGTEYSPYLVGPYFVFLPPTFSSRQGSYALAANDNVSYAYVDSLLVNGKYRKEVMEVHFSAAKIHGFDEIDFANNLGIIRMVDNSGRFPVVYTLDSAQVNVIYR